MKTYVYFTVSSDIKSL